MAYLSTTTAGLLVLPSPSPKTTGETTPTDGNSERLPRRGRKPAAWTRVDRDYETLRINMQTLFHDLGITTGTAVA